MGNEIEWEDYLGDEDAPFPLPNDDDIAQAETKLGIAFPADYKRILKQHQGQHPEPNGIPIGKGQAALGCLFHVFEHDERWPDYSIFARKQRLDEDELQGLVPFSSNSGNSYYCFDYREHTSNPPIVFVIGDYEPSDPRAIVRVASSFLELMDMLED